jgi:hypothetical protein
MPPLCLIQLVPVEQPAFRMPCNLLGDNYVERCTQRVWPFASGKFDNIYLSELLITDRSRNNKNSLLVHSTFQNWHSERLVADGSDFESVEDNQGRLATRILEDFKDAACNGGFCRRILYSSSLSKV